jgi:hypothetical protein
MARASLTEIPWHARAIWCDPDQSVEEKRRLLYVLWADAAEPEDPELGEWGGRARTIVEAYIQQNLPQGSPFSFPDEELARLNRSRGRVPWFDPYAPGAGRIVPLPEEPYHIDTLDDDDRIPYEPVVPSEAKVAEVDRALSLPARERRMRLFVAWDGAAGMGADADRAYVESRLAGQRFSTVELARYAALRGDDAFTRVASR